MLTRGEDVEAHALRERGWSISAIARHLERDPKTIRAYLNGERVPGGRVSSAPDPLSSFEAYVRARFVDDCHLWATALFDSGSSIGGAIAPAAWRSWRRACAFVRHPVVFPPGPTQTERCPRPVLR